MTTPEGLGFSLLSTRRFLPLFLAQFIGAFNDNLFRNALVILITYRLATETGANAQIMVTLAAGLFVLPFLLLSATAGQLADKYERAGLIRIVKFTEILCMALGAVALYWEQIWLLQLTLFLTGVQAAFFGPLKYGILPDLLEPNELVGGNALISAGTFLAILLGTILGGVFVLNPFGLAVVAVMMVGLSVVSWVVSLQIPRGQAVMPGLRIGWNIFGDTVEMMRVGRQEPGMILPILGISWFWFVGSVFLAQFPTFAHDALHANERVVTLFFLLFSVGIGIGSLLCNKLLAGRIHANYVPFGALGMAWFTFDLTLAAGAIEPAAGEALRGLTAFLAADGAWRIVFDITLIAMFGGLYNVPLYALVQHRANPEKRARLIASLNIYNALFMAGSALFAMVLLALGFSVVHVFAVMGALTLVALVIICRLLPMVLLRTLVRGVLRVLFRVKLEGLEHYDAAGPRAVIISNHVSFLDAVLLVAFLPDRLTFAINSHIANQWWVRPFLQLVEALPLDPTNPLAMKHLVEAAREDRRIVIFPEGRITVTGGLMKMYQGPGMIADKTGAPLLPVRIQGPEYSYFSRMKSMWRVRAFPPVRISILPAVTLPALPTELRGKARRQRVTQLVYDVMSEGWFATSNIDQTLMEALLEAMDQHGSKHLIAEDIKRTPLSYRKLMQRSFALGALMSRQVPHGHFGGVLLPNSAAALVTFFGLHAYGRVPAMLNFSTGLANVKAACQSAKIQHVYTARAFVEQAKLEGLVEGIESDGVHVHYLEDMAEEIGWKLKLRALASGWFPRSQYQSLAGYIDPNSPAVVLFTSGSEGVPKGVVLSHRNLLANRYQLAARLDFGPKDVIFNALPMFHSFGLTGAVLLPLLSGIRIFLYPSPLHYRIVPELAYDVNATIFFGTDTFLTGYARYADPYDFRRVRYVFAGAEKVKDTTRNIWFEKYGIRILEGYGATETAPALTVNTPMHNRAGSVGRLLPGIDYRLEPVKGIETGGRLVVKGPNVMLGYLKPDRPGVIEPPEEGWYDTGDIVSVDEQRYVTILGRAKRFAKIGGEMVSLAAVEEAAGQCWPGSMHGVVSLPDAKKGEQLLLFTDKTGAEKSAFQAYAKKAGMSELFVPRHVRVLHKLPLLPTGKVDYPALQALAEEKA